MSSTFIRGPSPARAWYIVGLLAVLYALSFIDRFILALLVEPVSAQFNLTDLHQGLLLGAGFAFVYSFAGLPLAHLIDQKQRRYIIAGGATLWGLTTIASGLAQNVETLLICRAGVAIGEAVLTPAAISLISDLFPREKRSLPVSVYVSVAIFMGAGSFVVGAAALDLARLLESYSAIASWRITLFIVGTPPILAALVLLLTVPEPPRQDAHQESAESSDLAAFLRYIGGNIWLYAPMFLGVGVAAMISFAMVAWMPTILIRGFGLDAAAAGYLVGSIAIPAGLFGVFAWPWIARRIGGSKVTVASLFVCLMAGVSICAVSLALASQAGEAMWLLSAMGVAASALAVITVLTPLTIQMLGPSRMQARLVATSFLCSNVIGFSMGPLLVPVLADFWPADPRALAYGLATLAATAGPLAVALFLVGRLALRSAQPVASGQGAASAAE